MLAVTRHNVAVAEARSFLDQARSALRALGGRPGYRSGRITRALDDPTVWVVVTEWDTVGSYRRALSAYEVRLEAVPLLATAHDEPTAFEVLHADGRDAPEATATTDRAADAGRVGIGDASGPDVPTDLD